MNTKQFKSDPIKTILVITVGLLVVFMATGMKVFLVISLVIGLIGVFSNYLSKKVEYLWMKLAWVLSFIVPNILMTIVFYLWLTPIALISRIFNKNDQLFLKNTNTSLFKEYNKTFDKKSFENPW